MDLESPFVLEEGAQVKQVVRVQEYVLGTALDGVLFDDRPEVLLHEPRLGAALELEVAEEASEGFRGLGRRRYTFSLATCLERLEYEFELFLVETGGHANIREQS